MFITYSNPDTTDKVLATIMQSSEDIFGVKLSVSPYFPPGDKRRPAAKSASQNRSSSSPGEGVGNSLVSQPLINGTKQVPMTNAGINPTGGLETIHQEPLTSMTHIVNGGHNPALIATENPPPVGISTNNSHLLMGGVVPMNPISNRNLSRKQQISEIAEFEKRLGDQVCVS